MRNISNMVLNMLIGLVALLVIWAAMVVFFYGAMVAV